MRYTKAKDEFERYFVLAALIRNGWRIQASAADLGLTRQGLDKLRKKYSLKPSSRLPDPASFIAPTTGRVKMIRRMILFYPDETVWMKTLAPATYGQLVRAGLKLLRRQQRARIMELAGVMAQERPRASLIAWKRR